ncbi:MAG: right-handed parallel beta-helix repeat-containing protein [Anaerolineaceae bacterium]|nr:right-handed parallel beta-helix repeat-containing protein [Anaerolineaceae bacterium]
MRYILIALVLLLCTVPALATDYILDENCGLADALRAANADMERRDCPAGEGADTITLTADITLDGELPRVISDITIDGAGHTISGDGEWRVFYVDMGGSLTLRNIHLTEARAHSEVSFISVWGSTDYSKSGGAILVNRGSRLELVNSRFTDNAAADFGGVLDAWDSEVVVSGSSFSGNKAEDGGAIASALSVVTISNSTFEGNRVRDDGGALQVFSSTAYVTDSQFIGNAAARRGGAITVFRGTIEQSGNTFSDNVGGDCDGC